MFSFFLDPLQKSTLVSWNTLSWATLILCEIGDTPRWVKNIFNIKYFDSRFLNMQDYVEAMWLILQQESPDDFVIATGQMHSVRYNR